MNQNKQSYVLPTSEYDVELQDCAKKMFVTIAFIKSTKNNVNFSSAQTMQAIGDMYYNEGKLQTALNSYTTALTMIVKGMGEKHILSACIHSKIASVYKQMGNDKLALKSHKQVLEIVEYRLDKEHPLVANVCETIALLQFKLKAFGQALENLKRVLEIKISVHGMCHPRVASTLNNVGNLYFTIGNLSLALIKYTSALEIMKTEPKGYADSAARTLLNIGNIYVENGDIDDAVDCFRAAIDSSKHGSKEKAVIKTCNQNIQDLKLKQIARDNSQRSMVSEDTQSCGSESESSKNSLNSFSSAKSLIKSTISDVLPKRFPKLRLSPERVRFPSRKSISRNENLNLQSDKEAMKIDEEIREAREQKRSSSFQSRSFIPRSPTSRSALFTI